MARLPDLVHDTRLNTSIQGGFTIHHHDDSDDENDARSTLRSEYWKTTALLGHGGCGDVWLQECVEGKRSCDRRAVKVIPRLNFKDKKDNYMTELEAIAKFSQKRYSKCFVKLLGWYDVDSSLYIAMEHFPLGDLQNYMSKTGPIDETDAREISFQVLEGLSYMHREGFAHRDIKPANMLIRAQPPKSKWWVKISDFGISKRVEGPKQVMTSARGTVPYMAPELLSYEPNCLTLTLINHEAADMWALGEMAYRMLTQTAVFPTPGALQRYLLHVDPFPTQYLSQRNTSLDATSFIGSLMEPQPEKRLTSEKAMEHAWVVSLKDHWTHVSKLSTPTPLVESSTTQQLSSIPNPDPWATVSSNGFDGSSLADYQSSAEVQETTNNSSLDMLSPLQSSKTIQMKDYSDANNTTGDSIAEPASGISGFESDVHKFDIAPKINDIPSPLMDRVYVLSEADILNMHVIPTRESSPRTPPTLPLEFMRGLEGVNSGDDYSDMSRVPSIKSRPIAPLFESSGDENSGDEGIRKSKRLFVSRNKTSHHGGQTEELHPHVLTERLKSVQAASCTQCQTPFSSSNEGYLCPSCGKFFDSKCSSRKTPIWYMDILEPVRVDDECFATITGVMPNGKDRESRKPQRRPKAVEANQGKPAKASEDEPFDLLPHLRKRHRNLFEKIRDNSRWTFS
ncbi:kinase-like protein [Trichoderma barbatum]